MPWVLTLGWLFTWSAACADDAQPAIESNLPTPSFSEILAEPDGDTPDLGLRIEGDNPNPGVEGDATRGTLVVGEDTSDRVLYQDDHHRVVGNPSQPMVRMMYRVEPSKDAWYFDGHVVRGHVKRGSNFGWSVAVNKPYMAIMDWSAEPSVAAIIIYEKTPNSLRGWKKRFEVLAQEPQQADCMGGLDASKWLQQWRQDRGVACGVVTLEGSRATRRSVSD
jgi:hypothetical protein